jgi:hypothetical protein
MFDDLVNKDGVKNVDSGKKTAVSSKDIIRRMKDEFEDAHHKHLTKSTSRESYCNDLETIIIRALGRSGFMSSSGHSGTQG